MELKELPKLYDLSKDFENLEFLNYKSLSEEQIEILLKFSCLKTLKFIEDDEKSGFSTQPFIDYFEKLNEKNQIQSIEFPCSQNFFFYIYFLKIFFTLKYHNFTCYFLKN